MFEGGCSNRSNDTRPINRFQPIKNSYYAFYLILFCVKIPGSTPISKITGSSIFIKVQINSNVFLMAKIYGP